MAKTQQSPGSFLASMLEKYKLNPFRLAQGIHLSQSAVRLITLGKIKITTSVAMRLAKFFNTAPEFWLAMQMKWDIAQASKDKALMKVVKSISRASKSAAGGKGKSAKKPAAKKRAARAKKPAAKRPGAKRKTIAARKKPAATRAKTAGKRRGRPRGRPAKK